MDRRKEERKKGNGQKHGDNPLNICLTFRYDTTRDGLLV